MNSIIEAFRSLQADNATLDVRIVSVAILVALAASLVAALMYRLFYESRGTGSQVHRSFPLLGISITTLFICVQTSLPLSLGLLGALSIIRFRTPIKEPEEVGFIMLVIAAAICCATFNFHFLGVLYGAALATLVVINLTSLKSIIGRDGMILVSLPSAKAAEHVPTVLNYLKKQVRRGRLESTSRKADVTSIQYSFSGLKEEVQVLQVRLMEIAGAESVNIFFSRPGGIR